MKFPLQDERQCQTPPLRERLRVSTYVENGSTCSEWKWFSGPEPFPRSGLVLMAAST
jgi:hypothetical protein